MSKSIAKEDDDSDTFGNLKDKIKSIYDEKYGDDDDFGIAKINRRLSI